MNWRPRIRQLTNCSTHQFFLVMRFAPVLLWRPMEEPQGKGVVAMRGGLKALLLSAAVAIVLAPAQARADGYVSPWAGVNFGSDIDNGRGAFGVSAGFMGAGVIGGEFDFGYSPSFFGTKNDFGNNTVINAMGNVIVGIPIGGTYGPGFRPFVTGGLGLIRTQIDGGTIARVSQSHHFFGWNLGAGAMGFFNEHVGVRGDVRYLKTTGDWPGTGVDFNPGGVKFWRLSAGVAIR